LSPGDRSAGTRLLNQLVPIIDDRTPALVAAAGERADALFGILRYHLLAWCERRGLASIIDVEPLHAGAYIGAVTRSHSAPTAKKKLAAIPCCSIGS
jgi:hypothetical protein